jgi:hypothetical protein
LDQIKCSAIREIALLLPPEIFKTFSTFFIIHKLVRLIDESGLKVQSAIQLSEAADLVKQAVA